MSKYPTGKKRVIKPKNIAGVSHKKTGPDSFLLHALLKLRRTMSQEIVWQKVENVQGWGLVMDRRIRKTALSVKLVKIVAIDLLENLII